jgi:uncharacterized metal-binding protein
MSHRSILSHGVLVGTILRVAYVTTLVMLGLSISYFLWSIWQQLLGNVHYWLVLFQPWFTGYVVGLSQSFKQDLHLWVAGFIGLELGSISHSMSDTVCSSFKRFRRQYLQYRQQPKRRKQRRK